MWTAWNNGTHTPNGYGYGLKVPIADRDKYFRSSWKSVKFDLPEAGGFKTIEINVEKASFWTKHCHELICKELGLWLLANQLAPWEKRKPPRLPVTILGEGHFRLERVPAKRA